MALFNNLFAEQLNRLEEQTGGSWNWTNNQRVRNFLKDVRHIPFIFRQSELACAREIQSLFAEGAVPGLTAVMRTDLPITFHESVRSKCSQLVWSYCPVLPPLSHAVPESILQHLSVQDPPRPDSVGNHLRNMCLALGKDSRLRARTREYANALRLLFRQIDNIYSFLNKHGLQGDNADLRNTKCVLVNHNDQPDFVLGAQLCFNMEREIRPAYLLRVPGQYQHYNTLLSALGATQRPQDMQYAAVLRILNEKHGDEQVSEPNDKRAAKLSVGGLVQCLRETEGRMSPHRDAGHEAVKHLRPLFLPSEKMVLRPSHQLVFPDALHLKKRLKKATLFEFVFDLKECGDRGGLHGSMLPPPALGLRLLSNLVVEQLLDDIFLNENSADVPRGSKLAANLDRVHNILTSLELSTAIRRLFFHKTRQELDQREENVLDQFRECDLVCKKKVVTVLKDKETGQMIETTDSMVHCAIQKGEEEKDPGTGKRVMVSRMVICLEVEAAEKRWAQLLRALVRSIQECFKFEIDGLLFLDVLGVENPEDIAGVLTADKISDFNDHKAEREIKELERLAMPGRELTEQERLLLIDDPTLCFYEGEFVGYRQSETSIVLAEVVREVHEDVAEADVPVGKYEIIVGPPGVDTIVVEQLLLYKFGLCVAQQPRLCYVDGVQDTDVDSGPGPRLSGLSEDNIDDLMEEISGIVENAFKMERTQRDTLLRRLWRTYHPDKHSPTEQRLFSRLFQHLQKCIEACQATANFDFRRQTESVLVEEMRKEAEEARRLALVRTRHSRQRLGRVLYPDNEDDWVGVEEIWTVERRVFGTRVRHPARYIPPHVVPGQWVGGGWEHRGVIWCGGGRRRWRRYGRSHVGVGTVVTGPSEGERMADEVLQHLRDLRQLFGGTPLVVAEEARCSHPAQACYKAHQLMEQLLKVCLLCHGRLGMATRASHDLDGILQQLQLALPPQPQGVNLLAEEVTVLQPSREQAVAAWRAAESAVEQIVQAMSREEAAGRDRDRLLQRLLPQVNVQHSRGEEHLDID